MTEETTPDSAATSVVSRRSTRRRRRRASRPAAPTKPVEPNTTEPYVVLTIQTTGIHPTTGKIVSIDAIVYDSEFQPVDDFHAVIDPKGDPGPRHLHGLTKEDFTGANRFNQVLKTLDRLIDGRTLIVHDTPFTWGFIHHEARQAMASAAKANRNRNRNRQRRRQKVGHIPRPIAIADTLAGARRQGVFLPDTRIRTVARAVGINTEPAKATVERAEQPETEVSRAETLLVAQMYSADTPRLSPEGLSSDNFGLRRSTVRVDAAKTPRRFENPGVYDPKHGLVEGMEVVVAPEINMNPDIIIEAIVAANLAYSEKVTRQTSVVVCNADVDKLRGKAMHAHHKQVPLVPDKEFLKIVTTVKPGVTATAR